MANVFEMNYKRLTPFIGDMLGTPRRYKKYTAGECFMPLVFEKLYKDDAGHDVISITHWGEQNGDLMRDPDMELRVMPEIGSGMVEALTFRNDYLGIYQEVYPEPGMVVLKLKKDLNFFLWQWLKNIEQQGYELTAEKES